MSPGSKRANTHGLLLFTAICFLVLGAGILSHPWNVLCVYALATGLGLMYGATYLLTRRRPEVDYGNWVARPEPRGVKSRGERA